MNSEELKEKVFDKLVKTYIKTAKPVGSKILKRRYFKNLADSTIRLYLSDLVLERLLENIKFSVGRIPTDLGWRFYLEKNIDKINEYNYDDFFNKINDLFDIIDGISEEFKCYCILKRKKSLYEMGLENLFRNREFWDINITREFAGLLKDVKENIEIFDSFRDELKIFIGSEIPFKRYKNFSMVIGNYGDNKILVITLKRLDYPKLYGLLNYLIKNG
ncbi:MAG: hypothetical protein ACP5JU_00080 [Minisyncoccia bacterium]